MKNINKLYSLWVAFIIAASLGIRLENLSIELSTIEKIESLMNFRIEYVLVFVAVFIWNGWIYSKKIELSKVLVYGFSILFAVGNVSGLYYNAFEKFYPDKVLAVGLVILLVGYFYLGKLIINSVFSLIQSFDKCKNVQKSDFMEKYFERVVMAVIVLLWIPFLIYFWPGVAHNDGMRSLTFWYGKVPWTNHHPYFISVLMGICTEIGRLIGGTDQSGLFVYCMLQVVIAWIIIYKILLLLKKKECPYGIRLITAFFFICFPLWKIEFYSFQKDPIYSLVVVNLMLVLFELHDKENKTYSKIKMAELFIMMLLTCLFRNNGVFVIIGVVIAELCCVIKNKNTPIGNMVSKKNICGGILVVICYMAFINLGLPLLDVSNENATKESLSIFVQATARYEKYYSDEITEEEKEILNVTFKEFDELGDKYKPTVSDPVKDSWNKRTAKVSDYMRVWIKQFIKHPGCYIEAFLNHTYKYYSVNILGFGASKGNYNSIIGEKYIPDSYYDIDMIDGKKNVYL